LPFSPSSLVRLQYKLGKHRSNALGLVEKQPIIEVEGNMAVCDGGGGALGHPLEYIKLGARADYPEGKSEKDGYPCIYCGLRYRSKGGGGHH
jgi:NADH dehydrogenase (ubiquinone) Fe-S protein 6